VVGVTLGSTEAQLLAVVKLRLSTPFGVAKMRRIRLMVVGLTVVGACGRQQSNVKQATTERERDSVIGASRLPGATGVRGALRVADSAAARNARIDSAGN
jgi:hypothetical protein